MAAYPPDMRSPRSKTRLFDALPLFASFRPSPSWRLWPWLVVFFLCLPGCSLFVMGGKMLLGDMKQSSQFHQATHFDLAKSDAKVLVLCTASESIRAEYAAVEFDVLEGLIHRLKSHGIKKIVSPNAVAGVTPGATGVYPCGCHMLVKFDLPARLHPTAPTTITPSKAISFAEVNVF